MSIKNVEIQDSNGNVYYPHTDADVVKYGDTTVGASLSEMVQVATLTLINGWTNYGNGYSDAKCVKIGKVVHLSGLVASGTGTICYLPVGFRPSKTESCIVLLADDVVHGVLIDSNGAVIFNGTDNRLAILNTVQFIVD